MNSPAWARLPRLFLMACLTLGGGAQSACTQCSDILPGRQRGVRVDLQRGRRPISPLIYGINDVQHLDEFPGLFPFVRWGGNRTSTYNWENNASNGGADFHHQNDSYLSESDEPGAAVIEFITRVTRERAYALVTVPMLDYVAADKRGDGDIGVGGDAQRARARRSIARSPEPGPEIPPDLHDDRVYQDAMVRLVEQSIGRESGARVGYSLDNEPGAWPVTHPRLRSGGADNLVSYRELIETSNAYAREVRRQAPEAEIFGPASFGFAGFMNLANAPDAGGRDFVAEYLRAMARAERHAGRRLLDVLDVHFYPHVSLDDTAIAHATGQEADDLRMQVPRSLYDEEYREPSWVVRDFLHEPVELLPRLHRFIDGNYPGTRLAITEYHYGGGDNISGAVAQADVLGAYGRHRVYAAALWPLFGQPQEYVLATFRLFRGPEGVGMGFAPISVPVREGHNERFSIWASTTEQNDRVTLMVINRTRDSIDIPIEIVGASTELQYVRGLRLDASGSRPQAVQSGLQRTEDGVRFRAPGPSVTLVALTATAQPR